MTFDETNCIVQSHPVPHTGKPMHYAMCRASNCAWTGRSRSTVAAAKRDGVRHHEADS